jgi:hypothetical protein
MAMAGCFRTSAYRERHDPNRPKTKADLDAIAAAEAKRQRRAAKRAAHTTKLSHCRPTASVAGTENMSEPTTQIGDAGRQLCSSALLACPFCGELPKYEPWAHGHAPEYHWPHQIVHNCKILGQQICVRAHKAGMPDTKESVFSIWNTRASGQANNKDLARRALDSE